jgi:hypothetical protein
MSGDHGTLPASLREPHESETSMVPDRHAGSSPLTEAVSRPPLGDEPDGGSSPQIYDTKVADHANDEKAKEEIPGLRSLAGGTAATLGIIAVVTGCAVVPLLRGDGTPSVVRAAGIGLAAGAAGSAVAALLSLADRVSNGWELSDGTKRPIKLEDKTETFNARLGPLFLQRPILGAFSGWAVAMGFLDGPFQVVDISTTELCFWTLLVGFFAKTVLEALKGAVKGLVGRP